MTKRLVENQLSLILTVGLTGEAHEAACSDRQTKGHKALAALFSEKGMALFGKPDTTISEDFRYLPIELCECEWDAEEVGDKVAYSVWFHSALPFSAEDALALRALTLEAYTTVCGTDASYVRAELYQKWEETLRTPYYL